MARAVMVLVLVTACGRIGFDEQCVASAFIAPCGSGGALVLDGGEFIYDTDAGTLTSPLGVLVAHVSTVSRDVRVIFASSVVVTETATLRAIGGPPLAVVADDIDVRGVIDVSGRANERGAGGQACDSAERRGSADNGGAAGGGGGGLGASGGAGMGGDSDESVGGEPGVSVPGPGGREISEVVVLRGGCDGGSGGDGDGPGGSGGFAGGGVLLHAPRTWIQGAVRAHGGAGQGGQQAISGVGDSGGGGGGSGGMIVIEADEVSLIAGIVVANGGGGGEGSDGNSRGADGSAGLDELRAAPGGSSDADTDDNGGDGGFGASPAGSVPAGPVPVGGGGGGGGGVGILVIRATVINDTGSIISPTPRS